MFQVRSCFYFPGVSLNRQSKPNTQIVVSVCIAGTNTDKILTAEPAVSLPVPTDTDFREFSSSELPLMVVTTAPTPQSDTKSDCHEHFVSMSSLQAGAVMRRNMTVSPNVAARGTDGPFTPLSTVEKDTQKAGGSPFIKLSSLGKIREGLDGEMYLVDNDETQKDK